MRLLLFMCFFAGLAIQPARAEPDLNILPPIPLTVAIWNARRFPRRRLGACRIRRAIPRYVTPMRRRT